MESDVFAIFRAFVLSFHVFSSVSIAPERTAVGFPYVSNHLREITHLPIFYILLHLKRGLIRIKMMLSL